MSDKRAQEALAIDIHRVVDSRATEWELSLADVLGVLEVIKWEILRVQTEGFYDDDDEDSV